MSKFSAQLLKRIKELQSGESVSAFARRIDVKQQTLDACLKGQRKPSVEMIYTIACKLGVSVDWLLGLSDVREGTTASVAQPFQPQQPDLLREIRELKQRVNALESTATIASCG